MTRTIVKASRTLVDFLGSETTPMCEDLVARLKKDEGFYPLPYPDSEGHDTIGYGTKIDKGITKDEGELLLRFRLFKKIRRLESRLIRKRLHPPVIERALYNMAYQMGVAGVLKFKKTFALLDQGCYAEAAVEAADSEWYRKCTRRAKRVCALIVEGENWKLKNGQWEFRPPPAQPQGKGKRHANHARQQAKK